MRIRGCSLLALVALVACLLYTPMMFAQGPCPCSGARALAAPVDEQHNAALQAHFADKYPVYEWRELSHEHAEPGQLELYRNGKVVGMWYSKQGIFRTELHLPKGADPFDYEFKGICYSGAPDRLVYLPATGWRVVKPDGSSGAEAAKIALVARYSSTITFGQKTCPATCDCGCGGMVPCDCCEKH